MKTTASTIPLWPDAGISASLTRHAREDALARPAILVIPGGGYAGVCWDYEGIPIADRFDAFGYQTFFLNYRTAPNNPWPATLADAVRAMRLIRGHGAEWGVQPDAIAVCGFSAGGHLAAALGTIADAAPASAGDRFDAVSPVPNAMLLCYPVILSGEFAHKPSVRNFFCVDKTTPEQDALFSLDRHVSGATPPAFLWTTGGDKAVPPENAFAFADAMRQHGRPVELHLFPRGPHGMQLGYGRDDVSQWPSLADAFLRDTCGFRLPDRAPHGTVVLTFDDATRSHLEIVAPLLKRHGFGATFFITRFNDDWRAKHEETLLDPAGIRALADMGFEIGNHTWNHADRMDGMDDAAAADEIDSLDRWLDAAGVPAPKVYAYPGGPYSAKGEALLRARGYLAARTTEKRLWHPAEDNPFQIPAIPIQEGSELDFYSALADSCRDEAGGIPVLVFHGVPDRVHPWVNAEPSTFEDFLTFLRGQGYRCVSLGAALRDHSRCRAK